MSVRATSLFLLAVLCVVIHANNNQIALMTTCLNDITECPSDNIAQYPVCGDCAAFIKCAGGATNGLFNCSSGLHYDVILGVCQFSDLANTNCQTTTSSTTTTTTTTTTTSPTSTTTPGTAAASAIPGCIASCDGQASSFYPSCSGCTSFFVCVDSLQAEVHCQGNKEWDNTAQECVVDSSTCP